jgi:hypothetical protein
MREPLLPSARDGNHGVQETSVAYFGAETLIVTVSRVDACCMLILPGCTTSVVTTENDVLSGVEPKIIMPVQRGARVY